MKQALHYYAAPSTGYYNESPVIALLVCEWVPHSQGGDGSVLDHAGVRHADLLTWAAHWETRLGWEQGATAIGQCFKGIPVGLHECDEHGLTLHHPQYTGRCAV